MTATSDQRERFTEGRLLWPLLTLAAPLVATQLLQVLYNLTDTFWVGRLGADAVSAVSFAWAVVFLLLSVGGGFTAAGTILVSQHTGAGNDDRVGHVAGQTIAFTAMLSTALAVVGYLATPALLALVGAPAGTPVHDMATAYTRTVFLGVYFMFGFFVFQALLRGWGDTTTPMYLMAGSVGLNVLIDPVFVLGFADNPLFAWVGLEGLAASLAAATGFEGLGVQGAAIATVCSRGVAAVIGFWLLTSDRVGIRVALADLRPRLATVRRVVSVGAPVSVEQSTQAMAGTVLTALVAVVGADAVAGFGVGMRVTSLVWLPTVGMGMAVETVVGQNVGAGRVDRARRTVLLAAGILAGAFALVSVAVVTFAESIVAAFVTGSGAAAVVAFGAGYLGIVAPTYAVMGVFHMLNGGFHGAGATRLSMLVGLTSLWGMRAAAAAAFLFGLGMGATGVWYGIALSNVTAAVVGAAFFLRGTWLGSVVEDDDAADAADSEDDALDDESAPAPAVD